MKHLEPRAGFRWFLYGVILAMAIVVVVLSVVSFILSHKLTDASARLTKIEAKDVADDAAKKVGEIATCYATARGRPQTIVILRGLAAKLDPNPRAAMRGLIDKYESDTPTLAECDAKAKKGGFTRKDFPPANRSETSRGNDAQTGGG